MMNKGRLARVMESPILTISLVLVMSILSVAWYGLYAGEAAPKIPGYDWAQHPNALLITVPSSNSCGSCGPSVSEVARTGVESGLDVLVVAPRQHPEIAALRKAGLPQTRLVIVTNVSQEIIRRFSPHGRMAVAQVRNGHIVKQAEGNMPQISS